MSNSSETGRGNGDHHSERDNERAEPIVTAPPSVAGGWGTIASTMTQLRSGPGLLRGARAALAMNQPHGFDCPGCAWPDPTHDRSAFEFCENGVKALAWESAPNLANREFFATHDIEFLRQQSEHWLGQRGRIEEPMWRPAGASHYQPIAWDDAFALLARQLNALPSPGRAAFYTSGRTSNEAAFLYQLFVRLLGTNNLPDCSNLCHESSGVALKQAIGVGKGTVQLEDFAQAELILVIGQNPGTNHPRMMTTLQEAAERGCKIVSINPLAEVALSRFAHPQQPLASLGPGTPIASMHLPVRIGGDVALLRGVMKELLEAEARRPGTVVDHEFIAAHTVGFSAFAEALAAESWDVIERESGIARAQLRELADQIARSRRIIACWAMGLTQHQHAIANIQEVTHLLMLRGALGRPGAGVCPVRGHSNVQGDRTMGITAHPESSFLDALEARYHFPAPRASGLDVVATIEAMERGDIDVLVGMGGNFLSACPDTERTAVALSRCSLTVHVSTKLNHAHTSTGREALILPCLGRSERDQQATGPQFVTVEDSMGVVHRSQGVLHPASPHLLSEPAIVCRLAERTFSTAPSHRQQAGSAIPWIAFAGNYDLIRDEIAAALPAFSNFNSRVRAPNGFTLPNPVRERIFPTKSGRAHFTVHAIPQSTLRPGQLRLTTIRSHDQFNTTIYGLDDRYRGIKGGRRVVFLNVDDIRERRLAADAWVDLVSHFQGEIRVARRFRVVPYNIPRGSAAAYFPEANPLVPLGQLAAGSRTPASKSVVIEIVPASDMDTGTSEVEPNAR